MSFLFNTGLEKVSSGQNPRPGSNQDMKPNSRPTSLTCLCLCLALLFSISTPSLAFECQPEATEEGESGLAVIGDLLLVRPLLFGATLAGSGLFTLALPFTAISDNTPVTADHLVRRPGRATFQRCLGCFEAGWYSGNQPTPPCPETTGFGWATASTEYPDTFVGQAWEWQAGQWRYQLEGLLPRQARDYPHEEDAVVIHFQAGEYLNLYRGRPHAVSIKLLQLSDPGVLDHYRGSSFRLADLLALQAAELHQEVLSESRLVLLPGERRTLTFNRVKDARHLAILAGYYGMQDATSLRRLTIPAVNERDPPPPEKSRWWWPFGSQQPPVPEHEVARLKIWIELGEDRIEQLRALGF